MIFGDLNIDFLKPLPSQWHSFLSYDFHQMVIDPTRVTSTSVTLIDHIYTTFPDYLIDVQVPFYAPGDHYPICCTINKFKKTNNKENKHMEIQYRNFKKFSEDDFIKDLTSQPFDVIFEIEDPNKALDLWYNFIKTI